MHTLIVLTDLYADALDLLSLVTDETGPASPCSAICPFDTAELLAVRPDISKLMGKLAVEKGDGG